MNFVGAYLNAGQAWLRVASRGPRGVWSGVIVAGLALLLLIYPALVIRRYLQIMLNLLDEQAPEPENSRSQNVQPAGREIKFKAADGHPLAGVILTGREDAPYRGMVVFAHEVGRDKSSGIRYCRSLLNAGYDVFAFDFRGHGASPAEVGYRPRQWPSDREVADLRGAIAFITAYLGRCGRPREVGLFGVSRGAGAAILASVGDAQVRAVVTDGAFSSDAMIEWLMQRWATIFARIRIVAENHPPLFWQLLRWLLFRECVRKFGCRYLSVRKAVVRAGPTPILLIHGEKDSYIPIEQTQALYDRARGPKELWIVPGAKHNQGIVSHVDEYARRILSFFGEHLSVCRPQPVTASPYEGRIVSDTPPAQGAYAPAYVSATVDSASGEA